MVFKKGHIPWNKGRKHLEETKRKMSIAMRGRVPWNKGLKTGPLSEEHKRKISEGGKGKTRSEETRRKMSMSQMGNKNCLGNTHSEETKRKISVANRGKTPWIKGRRHSEESKRKMSVSQTGENNGFYGRKRSEEFKHRMSIRMSGEKNHNWGKPLSKETRKKLSDALKGNKNAQGYKHSEEARKKLRIKRLEQVFPKKDTFIETTMQEELDSRGIVFKTHVPLLGKYQVDIKINDLIIECDGNYWHSFPDGLEKDRRRDTDLRDAGYSVLRFWGSEIKADVAACVDRVVGEIIMRGDVCV